VPKRLDNNFLLKPIERISEVKENTDQDDCFPLSIEENFDFSQELEDINNIELKVIEHTIKCPKTLVDKHVPSNSCPT